MPKIVNHEMRREEILEASWRVIVRLGLDGTTIRELAKESGYSHGTLAHYFKGKEDVLASALDLQHRRIAARMRRHFAESNGIEALRQVILEALPLDRQRLLEAQIEMNFWVRSMTTPSLRERVVADLSAFRRLLTRAVAHAREAGELNDELSDEDIVHEFMLLIDGLSVEAVLSEDLTPPKRQLAMLERLLRRLADRLTRSDISLDDPDASRSRAVKR